MPPLRLSPHLSWHARGEAAFSWHLVTGDVCEMSRDVVALCIAFCDIAESEEVCARALSLSAGSLDPVDARRYVEILVERGVLIAADATEPDLARYRPVVPRFAIWERRGEDAVVYGRERTIELEKGARLLERADGTRVLGELAPRARWPRLLPLVAPEIAALKLLTPTVSGVPRWVDSTMPWPRIDPRAFAAGERAAHDPADLATYHARVIDDAEAQFEETETTLSHLFREPHRALGGETFGQRLAAWLVERGVPAVSARVVEVGGGLGFVGRALSDVLRPSSYLVVDKSPALARAQRRRGLLSVVGDALRLPLADGSVDLVVSNEMAGDLGSTSESNHGALALVDEIARVLRPGGIAWVSEFGHPTDPPRKSDHLDHDEFSLRFEDLRARAVDRGLAAELVQVPKVVRLDGSEAALVTTRASFASLRALFRAHGGDLTKRAWLADELAAHARRHAIDLAKVHGVVTAPVGERTMGLVPDEFWALVARRP